MSDMCERCKQPECYGCNCTSREVADFYADRVRELEAELANGSFYQEKDIDAMQNRIKELEAQLVSAAGALEAILKCWDGPAYKHVMGPNIDRTRAAIRALKITSQT